MPLGVYGRGLKEDAAEVKKERSEAEAEAELADRRLEDLEAAASREAENVEGV